MFRGWRNLFRNNRVNADYTTKVVAKDLRRFNTEVIKQFLLTLVQNPEFVEIKGDTWLWKGPVNANGYPRIRTNMLPGIAAEDRGKYAALHRLMYEVFVKHAPVNACICHRSNVPNDINPDNLYEGTYANNSSQVIIDKRRVYPKGEDHHRAKVTSADIKNIVNEYYANAKPVYQIAEEFGLSVGHTSKLIHGHVRSEETRIAREEQLNS